MEDNFDEKEEFFEFFHHRPVAYVLLVSYGSVISAIEIFANLLVLLVKLRNKKDAISGFDVLAINLAAMFIVKGIALIQFIIHETFYDLTNDLMCNVHTFLDDFELSSICFTLAAMVIVAKYFAKVEVKYALIAVGVIWIISIFDAIPAVPYEAVTQRLLDGSFKNICSTPPVFTDFEKWRNRHFVSLMLSFAFPSVVFTIVSVIAIMDKQSSLENRNMVLHSVVLGSAYILLRLPMILSDVLYYYRMDAGYSIPLAFELLSHLVGVSNILVYSYLNKTFYKQLQGLLNSYKGSELTSIDNENE